MQSDNTIRHVPAESTPQLVETPAPGPASVSRPPTKPTFAQQFLAASGSSVAAAVVVNPLDVVKTRLQTQAASLQSVAALANQPAPSPHTPALDAFSCPPGCPRVGGTSTSMGLCGHGCRTYQTTLGMMRRIVGTEGVAALWRGTGTHVLMAVPLVGIYMPMYDNLLAELRQRGTMSDAAATITAGCISRAFSVFCVGPLELLRTRQQAMLTAPAGARHAQGIVGMAGAGVGGATFPYSRAQASLTAGESLARMGFTERVHPAALWRGTGATMLRDVPFSAMYWTLVEGTRNAVGGPIRESGFLSPTASLLATNMLAGTFSGALAAAATTPLDVVKTRLQTSPLQRGRGIMGTIAEVWRGGGARAFFTGIGPRSVRAAPACAIVISSYELLKVMLVLDT